MEGLGGRCADNSLRMMDNFLIHPLVFSWGSWCPSQVCPFCLLCFLALWWLEFLLRLLRPGCWEVQPGRGRKNGTRGIARGQSSVKLWELKPALASYLYLHNPHRLSLLWDFESLIVALNSLVCICFVYIWITYIFIHIVANTRSSEWGSSL